MEDRYKFAHKSKKNCVAHIEFILRARSQMINKNEHALQGVHNNNLAY